MDDCLKSELLDRAPARIVIHDRDHNIRWANRAYQKVSCRTLEQLMGQKCYAVLGNAAPCGNCEPLATFRDFSLCMKKTRTQELVEDALLRSEESLREAQRLAHIGSWELDLQSRTLSWSDEIHRIFGTDRERFNVSYEAFLNLVHPDDRADVDRVYIESVANREPYAIEHRLLLPDGSIKYVHDRCETFYGEDGVPLRSIGTVQDITERTLGEQENRKLQAQYAQAQKMESIGRLAGGVAHDFNNMLFIILGHVDMALERLADDDLLGGSLQEIRKAAERSANLTRQLLAFARNQAAAPRRLNLNDSVGDMLKMLQRLIGEDIDLAWLPAPDLGPVRIDPVQVDQILANLCVNARDAIDGVGKVTIETQNVNFSPDYCAEHVGFKPGSYVMLAVSDDGCGIPLDVMGQLFEPFFTTKEVGLGTGLGLSTVYGIVKQNDGFVNVYSEPGGGSIFKIYLPRNESGAEDAVVAVAEEVQRGSGEMILLVEDEAMILNLGRQMLESLGYQVMAANTPAEALQLAKAYDGEIDLLVSDVVMPGMNGRQLAVELSGQRPSLRTLYLSGYTANVIAHHGILQEGVNFLQKPFSKNDLAAKVRSALA